MLCSHLFPSALTGWGDYSCQLTFINDKDISKLHKTNFDMLEQILNMRNLNKPN